MKRHPWFLMAAAAAAVMLIGVLGCLIALRQAHADVATAQASAEARLDDLRRWSRLRAQLAGVAAGRAAATDVVAQVQKTLTAAGLPITAFRGIQPLAERNDPVTRIQERTVNLHLIDLRAADVGAWLAAWVTPDQSWQVVGITWTHGATGTVSGLDSDRYQITITLLLRTLSS